MLHDIFPLSQNGKTAYQLAHEEKHHEIMTILHAALSRVSEKHKQTDKQTDEKQNKSKHQQQTRQTNKQMNSIVAHA